MATVLPAGVSYGRPTFSSYSKGDSGKTKTTEDEGTRWWVWGIFIIGIILIIVAGIIWAVNREINTTVWIVGAIGIIFLIIGIIWLLVEGSREKKEEREEEAETRIGCPDGSGVIMTHGGPITSAYQTPTPQPHHDVVAMRDPRTGQTQYVTVQHGGVPGMAIPATAVAPAFAPAGVSPGAHYFQTTPGTPGYSVGQPISAPRSAPAFVRSQAYQRVGSCG